MVEKIDYSTWSHESLAERVLQLEKELKSKNASLQVAQAPEKKSWKKPRVSKPFDGSKYSTRLIALKLAYLGKRYNGFEHHTGQATSLTTIEEELWKALNKARLLIFPVNEANSAKLAAGELSWEGLDYSKCGRTDKGVSAFGQVIAIRVRSNKPLRRKKGKESQIEALGGSNEEGNIDALDSSSKQALGEPAPEVAEDELDDEVDFDPIADEIHYPSLLNRLLPPDIRILAWCPEPGPDFSARFACRERQYRYFFTQPAFAPIPNAFSHSEETKQSEKMKDGWLDIEAMRKAAKYFEGDNDFRNFCKIDGGKGITKFERTIFRADIEEVDDVTKSLGFLDTTEFRPSNVQSGNPKVYTFTLHGSAFLWHQVRCMVAVLFLVAQGLEKPEVVKELLDTKKNPRRPMYEMALDTPLVLWDCIFPKPGDPERKDAIEWLYAGEGANGAGTKYGTEMLMENLWRIWREEKIDEILIGSLMDVVAKQGTSPEKIQAGRASRVLKSQKMFDGGNYPRLQGVYMPVMKKPLMDSSEVINEKYALKKGYESTEDMKNQVYKRLREEQKPRSIVEEQ